MRLYGCVVLAISRTVPPTLVVKSKKAVRLYGISLQYTGMSRAHQAYTKPRAHGALRYVQTAVFRFRAERSALAKTAM